MGGGGGGGGGGGMNGNVWQYKTHDNRSLVQKRLR